jgi:hypothetical protein
VHSVASRITFLPHLVKHEFVLDSKDIKFIPNFVYVHPVILEMKQADGQTLPSLYAIPVKQIKERRLTDVAALTTLAKCD